MKKHSIKRSMSFTRSSAQKDARQSVAIALVAATNAFDTDAAVALFAPAALIDDPSTEQVFHGRRGIRKYIESYFVGYDTVARILALNHADELCSRLRLDFTGDFGHEIGQMVLRFDAGGLIVHLHAELE
ncbi:nuclear transport factor 2 family protein [Xanthomonas cassavae CFBP 4642]|uniref:Nuclear transport factor 2 family protein n=2 Tax=Xanthomonas cassavae TaxID=56450 RepID=A0ABS8HH71_9XANT|nr:nuclear transport factor 2 family protein [Xanthomonas cassavae]MCC4621524.1 nuclear transport factor 2 family protein [Xanthomonas cassavae CFBP 4642]